MALLLPMSFTERGGPYFGPKSSFLPSITMERIAGDGKGYVSMRKVRKGSLSIYCAAPKLVRDHRRVVKQNRIRFVQKLRTLLLSKPKHYMSLHILSKCRSYLALSKPQSIVSMIRQYPTLFEQFVGTKYNKECEPAGGQSCSVENGGGGGVIRRGWDVGDDKDALRLKLDSLGLGKEDVKVSMEDNTLIIKGEAPAEGPDEQENGVLKLVVPCSVQRESNSNQRSLMGRAAKAVAEVHNGKSSS